MTRALTYVEIDIPTFNSPEVEETVRYAMPAAYRPNTIDAIPSLKDVKIDPAIISLGQDLGQRATVTATFRDHRHIFNGELFESGTYWGKFRARYGLKLRGAPFRVIQGTLGQALADMETRHFIIESTDGPTNKGEYKIIAKDVIKLADGDRAQAPLPSNGFLNADVTSVATSFVVSPSGISSEYPGGSPSNFYVNVGGSEIMLVTSTSGDTFNVTRAQFNTVAVEHSAQDRVQLCLWYNGDDVADIIYDLLTTYSGVSASYISLPTWQTETGTFLNQVYTSLITEPTGVSNLVSELIEQAGLAVWWDEVDQLIKLQVLRPISTGLDTYDDDDIMLDSLKVTEQPDRRISQVITYFAQINPLIKLDQIDNYRSTAVTVDAVAEAEYGSAVIKKVYSRWIPSGGRTIAENLNNILLSRFRDPPRRVNFDLMRYSLESDPLLGQGYQVGSWVFQNTDGTAALVPVQLTRLNPRADIFEIEAEEFLFTAGAASSPDNRAIIIDSSQNDINLRTMHDSIYGAATTGIVVFCYVQTGVTVGSTSTSTPALHIGTWPGGVTINLIVEGRIQGCGGVGGVGGDAILASAFPAGSGTAGGTALYTRQAITLSGAGAIWGGGGGGGGGGGFTDNANPEGGNGGSGGAGTNVGAAGAGGFGTAANGSFGNPGTATAGGPGVPGNGIHGGGGAGGGPGLAGSAGQPSTGSAGSGAAAGAAIDSAGTVTGTVSDVRGSVT